MSRGNPQKRRMGTSLEVDLLRPAPAAVGVGLGADWDLSLEMGLQL